VSNRPKNHSGGFGSAPILLLKFAKFAKPLLTFGSFAVSVFAYSFSLGFTFAFSFVAMLMVHELGHVAALRSKGIKASLPVFVPFVGAAVFTPRFDRPKDEAYVALAGPFIGSLGAFGVLAIALTLPSRPEFLLLLAYTALLINAINLLPIPPLDGGRVAKLAGPWYPRIALVTLVVLLVVVKSPFILLIAIILTSEMNFSYTRRLVFGVFLEMGLLGMWKFGIGEHMPLWGWVMYLVAATFINGMTAFEVRNEKKYGVYYPRSTDSMRENSDSLTNNERMGWLGAWVGLAAVLVYLIVWIHPMLPASAR
jgi:Zn-dependent protease